MEVQTAGARSDHRPDGQALARRPTGAGPRASGNAVVGRKYADDHHRQLQEVHYAGPAVLERISDGRESNRPASLLVHGWSLHVPSADADATLMAPGVRPS